MRKDYLSLGDFTALVVRRGGGGAPAVRLVLLPDFGIAPRLSTLLGGVGAVEDWDE